MFGFIRTFLSLFMGSTDSRKRKFDDIDDGSDDNGNGNGSGSLNGNGNGNGIKRSKKSNGSSSGIVQSRQASRKKYTKQEYIDVDQMRMQYGNFQLDQNCVYHQEDSEEMRRHLQRSLRLADWNDFPLFVETERELRRRYASEPILQYFPRITISEEMNGDVKRTNCAQIHRDMQRNRVVPIQLAPRAKDCVRKDGKRIQICSNITENARDIIPAYCHISKDINTAHVPLSLTFKNTDRNITCASLKELDDECSKDGYVIKCMCHSQEPIVNCWENKDCPCYQMNVRLARVQREDRGVSFYGTTKFKTGAPILLKDGHFSKTFGFACSELCGCKAQCTNNVFLLPDMKLNKFELVREDSLAGFKVRALNQIPAGTPIGEFTGVITHTDRFKNDRNYAYDIVPERTEGKIGKDNGGKFGRKLARLMGAERGSKLEKLMVETYEQKWHIDPFKIGNVVRTLNHSCQPNTTLVRVFQKGFSPSTLRLLNVTTEDVFPGNENTLDYGECYLEQQLKFCLCQTPSCLFNVNGVNMSESEIEENVTSNHTEQFQIMKKNVLDKLDRSWRWF